MQITGGSRNLVVLLGEGHEISNLYDFFMTYLQAKRHGLQWRIERGCTGPRSAPTTLSVLLIGHEKDSRGTDFLFHVLSPQPAPGSATTLLVLLDPSL